MLSADDQPKEEQVSLETKRTTKKRKSQNTSVEGTESSVTESGTSNKRPRRNLKSTQQKEQQPVEENDISAGIFASLSGEPNNTIVVERVRRPLPTRAKDGSIVFPDFPEFRPNLTPKEVLQRGSFGGTYFRKIYSSITKRHYEDAWEEFPADWFEGLDIKTQVTSSKYNDSVNMYKVHCGADLEEWERSGWITSIDPYGWFQWYCRFYLGRRCSDDYRQISRALGVMGPSGRWRKNLVNKCLRSSLSKEDALNDHSISPKVRQLLQHWGYVLTAKDLK